jgi:small conductance mechanosensitive channel
MFAYQSYFVAAIAGAIVIVLGFVISSWAASRLLRRGATPVSVRGTRFVINVLSVLIAATVVFITIGPISLVSGLTFSAIAGLAVTLALQTTLQNIIAGFMLLQDRMLRMGDTITVSGVTGRVVRIGLVTVWLRTDDGSLAGMSNATLLSGPTINRSARDRLKGEY